MLVLLLIASTLRFPARDLVVAFPHESHNIVGRNQLLVVDYDDGTTTTVRSHRRLAVRCFDTKDWKNLKSVKYNWRGRSLLSGCVLHAPFYLPERTHDMCLVVLKRAQLR